MKKILTIALVALLAASTAFAGLSGSASLGLGYNFEDKTYGFSNDSEVKVTYELTSEEAGEVKEGTVYAGIKASFVLSIKDYKTFDEGTPTWNLKPSLDEAYVAGTDWKVSILGAQKSLDFATSAIDKSSNSDKDALVASSVAVNKDAAPGLTASYKDWKVSFGFHSAEKTTADAVYAYVIASKVPGNKNGLVYTGTAKQFKASDYSDTDVYVVLSKKEITSKKTAKDDYVNFSVTAATPEFVFGDFKVKAGVSAGDRGKDLGVLGFSGKVAYDTDLVKVSVASDLVLDNLGGDKVKVDADVALNAQYSSLVTFDAYYGTNVQTQPYFDTASYLADFVYKKGNNVPVKNLLSLKAVVDLKEFDVPVSLTAKAKNLVNDERVFGVAADLALENSLTAGIGFDYGCYKTDDNALIKGVYDITGKVGYKLGMFQLNAGMTYASCAFTSKMPEENKKYYRQLYFTAGVETSELVPGATLSLAYGPVTDSTYGYATSNLLDENGKQGGKLDFTCKIAF